jgi:hypothetical protein
MQALQTVGCYVNDITCFAKSLLEKLGSLDFVFDYQDLHITRA